MEVSGDRGRQTGRRNEEQRKRDSDGDQSGMERWTRYSCIRCRAPPYVQLRMGITCTNALVLSRAQAQRS